MIELYYFIQNILIYVFREANQQFKLVLKKLESDPICQSQEMRSFLILPMQRITRLPLLLEAVAHRMEPQSAEYPSVQKAVQALNKV